MSTAQINRSDRFGGIRPKRYRGGGGFSDVYEGFTPSGERVAIKVLRFKEDAQSLEAEKLIREQKILARINSRGVAKYIDSDLDNDPPWIASEYVDGPTLKEAIASNGPLSAKAVELLVRQIALSLTELHRESIAHRDLSPNNVILGPDGPVIIDFGSARITSSSAKLVSIVSVGTPGFLSPEVIAGSDSGAPADIFALSRIAEFSLTGQSETTDPKSFLELSPRLSVALAESLSNDPNNRPSAQDIVDSCSIVDSNIDDISAASYPKPTLKKIPIRFRLRTILAILALSLFSSFFAVQFFREQPITTASQVTALNALNSELTETKWIPISKPAGIIRGFSIPDSFSETRVRSTQTPNPLTTDLDAFHIQAEPAPRTTSFYVVASVELNLDNLDYDAVFNEQDEIEVNKITSIRDNLASEVEFREGNYLALECNFSTPEMASVDSLKKTVYAIATSIGCAPEKVDVVAIYFYPDLNLQVLVAGFFNPKEIEMMSFLNSILVSQENVLVAKPASESDLLTSSLYPGTTSRMFYFDNGTKENLDESFFYAKSAIWLENGDAIELEFAEGQESLYSAWGWTIDDEKGYQNLVPLGRLWTFENLENRIFSNSEFDSLLVIIELDSVTNIRPATVFRYISADPKHKLFSADEIDLGIGTYDDSRSFSYASDEIQQFGLPEDTAAFNEYPTEPITVGGVNFIIPSSWQLKTSPSNEANGLSDFLYAIVSPSGDDLSSLESDLPQLEITSEQLALTQSHKDTWYWIETDDSNCQSRSFFTYEGEFFYFEWVVRLNCKIRDAFSEPGEKLRQEQAAPLFQILVSKPIDTSSVDWPEPLLRINFTPETQEDLLFLNRLILSFRPAN
jgi:serine/threonine protein kinase